MPTRFRFPHQNESIWDDFAQEDVIKKWGEETSIAFSEALAYLQDNQRALEDWLDTFADVVDDSGGTQRSATIGIAASDALAPADWDMQADGTTDQTTFADAINDLPADGGRIILSEGTFNVTAETLFDVPNVTFEGQGPSTIIHVIGSSPYSILRAGAANITFANLKIDATAATGSTYTAMMADGTAGASNFRAFGVIVLGAKASVGLRGFSTTGSPSHNKIHDCFFDDCTEGVNIVGGSHFLVLDNFFFNCTNGIVPSGGSRIKISDNNLTLFTQNGILIGAASTSTMVLIENNHIEDASRGIRIDNPGTGDRYHIIGNWIEDTASHGISIGGLVDQVSVLSNKIQNCGGDGINVLGGGALTANDCILEDNIINGCVGAGIRIGGAPANTNIAVGNDTRFNGATIVDTGTGTILTYAGGAAPGDNF